MTNHTIPLDNDTQRFFQGAAAGANVSDAHAQSDFPDVKTKRAFYWFYVGALATGEYDCKSQEDLSAFIAGAATRQP